MTFSQKLTVFFGAVVHSLDVSNLEIILQASVGVDQTGTIVFVDKTSKSALEAASLYGVPKEDVTVISTPNASSFFFPGFFDTHIVSL